MVVVVVVPSRNRLLLLRLRLCLRLRLRLVLRRIGTGLGVCRATRISSFVSNLEIADYPAEEVRTPSKGTLSQPCCNTGHLTCTDLPEKKKSWENLMNQKRVGMSHGRRLCKITHSML